MTNNVIFGSGNANGGFTVAQENGIEIGLRGKVRFDENNSPQNVFNSNGDGSYDFNPGAPSPGFNWKPNDPQTAKWNFEWSINSNYNGHGSVLGAYDYLLELDGDAGAGTNFASFDPVNLVIADSAIGTNSIGNGSGTVATNSTSYASLIAANNVAQNSWNYSFFLDLPQLASFNPNTPGTYTIRLSALTKGTDTVLAESSIDINVVPLPASLPLLLGAIGAVGFIRRRKRV